MVDFVIERIDHDHEPMRRRLIDWLAPHETHAMFLIGNLASGYVGSHIYLARRGEQWLGLAGYYERPRSLCPFSRDPQVVRHLVRHITRQYPAVEFVNAIDSIGKPACQQMLELGYEPNNDPRQIFMELSLPQGGLAPVPHEEKARPLHPRDGEAAARLMRILQAPDKTGPIEPREIERVMMNPLRMVLEVDGRVVSTATTNGVGVEAFQILGVATDQGHRNKGYARAVCAALIRRMQAQGARKVLLFTGPENLSAQLCYEKLGFRITGDYCMAKFKTKELPGALP